MHYRGRAGAAAVSTQGVAPPESNTLPEDWCAVQSSEGQTYYWNTYTGDTTWDRPSHRAIRQKGREGRRQLAATKIQANFRGKRERTVVRTAEKRRAARDGGRDE